MKIIVLTSSLMGTAAHHLPYLLQQKGIKILGVVYSNGKILRDNKHYLRKLQKILKIGVLGAVNGILMRRWYGADVRKYLDIARLDTICRDSKIPFFVTPSINCERTRQLFREVDADVGISLGNGYIGKSLFSVPTFGMLNIHHEILPDFKNAQSVIWQLYFMSNRTGYSIHKIDSKIDTGDILFKEYIPIIFLNTLGKTVAATSANLLQTSAKGLIYVLENFECLLASAERQDPNNGMKFTTPTIFQYLKIYRNYRKLRDPGKR